MSESWKESEACSAGCVTLVCMNDMIQMDWEKLGERRIGCSEQEKWKLLVETCDVYGE